MIILTIIKWILIILLSLIACILCLLLWILLSKLTFHILYQGSQSDNHRIEVRGHYLLGILNYSFIYDQKQDVSYYLKLLFIKIFDSDKVKNKHKDSLSDRVENKYKDNLSDRVEDKHKESLSEKVEESDALHSSSSKENLLKDKEVLSDLKNLEDSPRQEDKDSISDHNSNCDKKDNKNYKEKTSIREKWISLKDKLSKLRKSFTKIKEDIAYLNMKEFIGDLVEILLYMKPFIKFTKLQGLLKFGLEDPSQTGYLTALLYYFLPIEEKYHLVLEPDFEEVILEGEVLIKGHIRFIRVVIGVIKLFLKKSVHRLIKIIRRK